MRSCPAPQKRPQWYSAAVIQVTGSEARLLRRLHGPSLRLRRPSYRALCFGTPTRTDAAPSSSPGRASSPCRCAADCEELRGYWSHVQSSWIPLHLLRTWLWQHALTSLMPFYMLLAQQLQVAIGDWWPASIYMALNS